MYNVYRTINENEYHYVGEFTEKDAAIEFASKQYEDPNGRYYHRLLIRSEEHPECDCSAPCDIEDGIDAVCHTIVEVFREQKGIELKY